MTDETDPRVDPVQPSDAPDAVREVYDEIVATREGEMADEMSLNGMWLSYGQTPELLRIVWDHMRESYRGGELSFELTSKVSLVAATVLSCEACRIFHQERLESEGVEEGVIAALGDADIEQSAFDEREYVVLRFTQEVAENLGGVTDADVDRLREVGLSEAEIVELVDCIALHVHTAVFQDTLGLAHEEMSADDYAGVAELD
ncbi:MAG: carboxymuconolactone decarboxylase family protein [Haloarculaceae archaeon]